MLVLFESAVGFSLFKLADGGKLEDKDLHKEFESPESANNLCVAPSHSSSFVPVDSRNAREAVKKIIHQAQCGQIRTGGAQSGRDCMMEHHDRLLER